MGSYLFFGITKEMLSKQAVQTKQILSKQAVKIAKQAEEHEKFINKVASSISILVKKSFFVLWGVDQFNGLIIVILLNKLRFVDYSSINLQVTHLLGVLGFGGFCFLLGASKLTNLTRAFATFLNVFL